MTDETKALTTRTEEPAPHEPKETAWPKAGQMVFFGVYGQGSSIEPAPALVLGQREAVQNGLPLLDLYVWNRNIGQSGFTYSIVGSELLTLGCWSTSSEPAEQQPVPKKAETRAPGDRFERKEQPKDPTGPQSEPDPQIDGVPNVFGGLTRYNPAVNRQQHSDDQGRLLYICPSCKEPRWFEKGSTLPEDGSCCAEAIRRRQPGLQAAPDWKLWRIPDDTVKVGDALAEDDE